jgi:hypothetical protein
VLIQQPYGRLQRQQEHKKYTNNRKRRKEITHNSISQNVHDVYHNPDDEESVFDTLVYFNHVMRLSAPESCIEQKNALSLCRSKSCLLKAGYQVDTQTYYLVIGWLWGGALAAIIRLWNGENRWLL